MDLDTARTMYQPRSGSWLTRVNPNKLNGDIFSYREYCTVVCDLFREMGIPDNTYYRVDLRLDSYEDTFKPYYKLNLLLISLFAIQFNDPNGQAIAHLLTQSKALSDLSAQNQYWQAKHYDKQFQTNDADPAKARLEFRCLKSTRTDGLPPHEFRDELFKRLDELPKHYETLQRQCNRQLLGAYRVHCEQFDKVGAKRDRASEFLSHYHNHMTIFSRRQLMQFLELCGVTEKRAGFRADNIAQSRKLEFISMAELSDYIVMLKRFIWDFFAD